MCIDTNAGVRHAAQLLQDGAEIEDIMASLPNFPPRFAEGMRRVIEDPVVQVELMKRKRADEPLRPTGPKPGIFRLEDGMFELWMEGNEAPEFHGVFSTALAAKAYRKEVMEDRRQQLGVPRVDHGFPGMEHHNKRWRVRRMINGRKFLTKSFNTKEEAKRAWAEMALYIEQESQKAIITGVGRSNGR